MIQSQTSVTSHEEATPYCICLSYAWDLCRKVPHLTSLHWHLREQSKTFRTTNFFLAEPTYSHKIQVCLERHQSNSHILESFRTTRPWVMIKLIQRAALASRLKFNRRIHRIALNCSLLLTCDPKPFRAANAEAKFKELNESSSLNINFSS